MDGVRCLVLVLVACRGGAEEDEGGKGEEVVEPAPVPLFGWPDGRELRVVGDGDDGLKVPRDLDWNPAYPEQLWVVNRATDSTTTFFYADTEEQSSDWRQDVFGEHFMEEVSSISFTEENTFGTCQESQNTYNGASRPNGFMGPALWPADLSIYAEVNQRPYGSMLGSHLDMLHQSPNCMGIGWESDNVFWVFDGFNDHLVYYDFAVDHGPGRDDHSDGIVRRYPEVELTRVEGVPGHVVVDPDSSWIYIADTGAGRVLRVDRYTGDITDTLRAFNEPLAEFSEVTGVTVETVVEGLSQPSGLELHEGVLLIGDHGDGDIVAWDLEQGVELDRIESGREGLMGLRVGPDGRLWFVDAAANELVVLAPEG